MLATSPEQQAEERRLLYVGVTRARTRLRISWATTRTGSGQRRNPPGSWTASGPTPRPAAPRPSSEGPDAAVRGVPDVRQAAPDRRRAQAGPARGLSRRLPEHTWQLLREWRKQEADEAGLPAFCVFTDATLMAIAERRPANEAELLGIAGVGRVKADRYGEAVLGLLALGG